MTLAVEPKKSKVYHRLSVFVPVQNFLYFIRPGTFQSAGVVQAAYNLNNPLQVVQTDLPESLPLSASYFTVDQPAVILENVKKVQKFN